MKVSPKYLILLVVTVFIVVIWSVVPYCLDALSGAESHVLPVESDTTDRQLASEHEGSSSYPRDFVYPVDNPRDPFVQVFVPIVLAQTALPGRKPGITLTGIIWNDENPLAIITDLRKKSHIVRTGDELNGTRIIAIHIRSVIIEVHGKHQELVLWPENL